jgi:PAS domain S-box-containing protein
MFQFSKDTVVEIMNCIHDALFVHDLESGKIVYVNQRVCELYNCTEDEALSGSVGSFSHGVSPYGENEARQWLLKARKEGEQIFEWIARKVSGEIFWAEVVLRYAKINDQPFVIAVIRDITERKKNEEEKNKSIAELRAIFDSSSSVIAIVDSEGVFMGGNRALLSRWGKKQDEIIGRSAREILPEHIFKSRLEKIRKVIRSKKTLSFTDNFNDNWYEVSVTPVIEDGDTVTTVAMFSQNITDRKSSEEKLLREHNLLTDIIESMSDAFVSLDRNWCYTYMNQKAGLIFGKDPKEMTGKHIWTEFPEGVGQLFQKKYEKVMQERISISMEEHYPPYDKWFENRIFPTENGISIFFQDITNRKKAEIALKESEEKFRILLEQAADGIFHGDSLGNFIGVNSRGCEMTGYSKQELLGMNMGNFFTEEEKTTHPLRYDLLNSGSIIINERKLKCKDGSLRIIEMHTKMMPDKTYQSIFRDITERKKAEALIKESETHYRTIFENTGTATVIIEENTVISLANSKFEELSEYVKEEIENKISWQDFVVREDLEIMAERHKQRRAENLETPKSYEFRFITKSGNIKDILLTIDMIPETKKSVASLLDITERKNTERTIRESEEKYRTLIESATDSIMIIREGKIQYINPALSLMSGFSEQELVGRPFIEYVSTEDREKVIQYYSKRTNGDTAPIGYEMKAIKKNGEEVQFEVTASLFSYMGDGAELVFLHDITERKLIENKIKQINEELEDRVELRTKQLESANKELEAFAYSVSHDLRAPLRAISGFTKILTEDYAEKIEDEGQRICNVILNESSRMGQLIDDLLSFSRLSKTSMQTSLTDMNALVRQIFEETRKQYSEKQVNFVCGELHPSIFDLSLIRQVWINLFSNAFKFSSRKERIEIKVGCEKKQNEVVYFIEDNGAGFDMKYIDKLFGVFQRLHNLKDFQGTGVGLAIVQRIVSRHGGIVWAESETDKGAKFYFTLPDNN